MNELQKQLAYFYNVETLDELVEAQMRHIERLQEKLAENPKHTVIHEDPFKWHPFRQG